MRRRVLDCFPRPRYRDAPVFIQRSMHVPPSMAALEAASVRQEIGPLADFLAGLVGEGAEPDGEAG